MYLPHSAIANRMCYLGDGVANQLNPLNPLINDHCRVDQSLAVGRPGAPLVMFAVGPEHSEPGPSLENRLIFSFGLVRLVPHPSQSGQLGP